MLVTATPVVAPALVAPADAWGAWTFDPVVVMAMIATGVLYGRGVRRRRRGARSRRDLRAASFAAGIVALAIALVSPLDRVAEALFSAHMLQHLLLVVVAPPLLVLGRPIVTISAGLSPSARRSIARAGADLASSAAARTARRPAVAWAALTLAMWGWHLPSLYTAALENPAVHALEHATFLATSTLAWSVALRRRAPDRLGVLGRALLLVASGVQSGVLGAVLLFASTPLYPAHGVGPSLWGLTPLEDQQLAGVLMWIPPSAVYLGAAGALLIVSFRSLDARAEPRPPRVRAVAS